MKRILKSLLGLFVLVIGLAGIAVAILISLFIWNQRAVAVQSIDSRLELVNQALTTTDQTLSIIKGSLQATLIGLISAQEAISSTAVTMASVDPLVNSATSLLRDDLPKTLKAAQSSLESAQTSAKMMDNVLRALTIFNPDLYNPPLPLDGALKQLADSLNGLPEALAEDSQNLENTRSSLQTTQQSVRAIATNLTGVKTELNQYETMIGQFRTQNLVLQVQIAEIQTSLPETIRLIAWGAIFLLGWVALAHLGLVIQGFQILLS